MDPYDYIYIMDFGNKRIQKWYPGATYGITVVSASSMYNPYGMKFDRFGNIVVADTDNYRIISFGIICCKFIKRYE